MMTTIIATTLYAIGCLVANALAWMVIKAQIINKRMYEAPDTPVTNMFCLGSWLAVMYLIINCKDEIEWTWRNLRQ